MLKGKSPLDILIDCNGYYESPRDRKGNILGPLTPYAARYKAAGGKEKQMVGPVYFNFAKAEEDAEIRDHFAKILAR